MTRVNLAINSLGKEGVINTRILAKRTTQSCATGETPRNTRHPVEMTQGEAMGQMLDSTLITGGVAPVFQALPSNRTIPKSLTFLTPHPLTLQHR